MQRTVIVNLKHEKCDVKCDRSSVLYGNPYRIGRDGTRDEVVEKYGKYFAKRLQNESFRNAIDKLKGKRLGCWCSPLKCHLEWIVVYLENKTQE